MDFYFFKLTQPLTVFTVQLLYTVKEKEGKPYPLNLVSEIHTGTSSLKTLKVMPRTTTKLYVHEFGFSSLPS
jgi:hypothetical protein